MHTETAENKSAISIVALVDQLPPQHRRFSSDIHASVLLVLGSFADQRKCPAGRVRAGSTRGAIRTDSDVDQSALAHGLQPTATRAHNGCSGF